MRFNQFTVYTDDMSSVMSAKRHSQGEEAQNLEPRLRPEDLQQAIRVVFAGNGKERLINPANGANKLKDTYLCKFNPDYVEESGDGSGEGSGEEGSGADTVVDAVVSM